MFITFEGVEGSGKTVQIRRTEAYLRNKQVPCLVTREPGGTEFGSAVRRILLCSSGARREPLSELLLYIADRVQHLREVVLPALSGGVTVLSDRYHDATRAYQGGARGIPLELIDSLANIAGIPDPDRTILLDLDPHIGLERARRRNRENAAVYDEGRFEDEELSFHRSVRAAYLDLARRSPARITVIPAGGSPEEVFQRVAPLLDEWFR